MVGFLTASEKTLTEEEYRRYKSCYCGLCQSLKRNYGNLSRLTLNYDMTFLILTLNSLYEPEEEQSAVKCIAHPFSEQDYFISEVTDYAADMNVALSYLKCLDDWRDDDSLTALAAAKVLEGGYEKVKEKYPMQCAAMEQGIFELHTLEDRGVEDPDAAAATYGHIMGAVFQFKGDRWSDTLYQFGDALGRFIYLLDAMVDLSEDTARNHYNPFRRYYGLENNYELFSDILKMFLADAVAHFETLPLVQDVSLIKNILCNGVWRKFEETYGSV